MKHIFSPVSFLPSSRMVKENLFSYFRRIGIEGVVELFLFLPRERGTVLTWRFKYIIGFIRYLRAIRIATITYLAGKMPHNKHQRFL